MQGLTKSSSQAPVEILLFHEIGRMKAAMCQDRVHMIVQLFFTPWTKPFPCMTAQILSHPKMYHSNIDSLDVNSVTAAPLYCCTSCRQTNRQTEALVYTHNAVDQKPRGSLWDTSRWKISLTHLQAPRPEEGQGSRCDTLHRTCRTGGCVFCLRLPSIRSSPPRVQKAYTTSDTESKTYPLPYFLSYIFEPDNLWMLYFAPCVNKFA